MWWSSVAEPLLWTAGVVAFFLGVRWMLLDYVLDTLGPAPLQPPTEWRSSLGDADTSSPREVSDTLSA